LRAIAQSKAKQSPDSSFIIHKSSFTIMNDLKKFELKGKTILITGGAGFLGQLFGKAVADAGANVVLADLNLAASEKAAGEIAAQTGGTVVGMAMDVTNKENITATIDAIVARFGSLDVTVNNAGLDPKFDATVPTNDKQFENYPEEFIRKSLEVNLLGATLVAQASVKQMLKQGFGNIINISSLYGINGPDQKIYPEGTQKPVDYSISKGGLVMLTKWLATSYANKGIRANTMTLGGVIRNHPEDFQKKYGAKVPDGKMVGQDEIGSPLIFLASQASSGVNGCNLIVDHGFSAY